MSRPRGHTHLGCSIKTSGGMSQILTGLPPNYRGNHTRSFQMAQPFGLCRNVTDIAAEGWCNQEYIGWNCLMDGWVAKAWGWQQGNIWALGRSQKSNMHWKIELIKKLWNVVWDMWEHCNSALHILPHAQQKNIVESQGNEDIWACYSQGPRVLPWMQCIS